MPDDIVRVLGDFESSLGLQPGFIDSLGIGDDWSFIIKSSALLEAGVSHLLTHHFGNPNLLDISTRMTWSPQAGKLAFLNALNLLDQSRRPFIIGVRA
jgi:hypothetical protein